MNADTLSDRYVREVVRRIPADQRDDVADELRGTIADTIDAREPDDREAAEREVLTEMGDPIRLAARYADRPLALIGPDLYPTYIRLLVLLLSTVLPVVVVATAAIDVIEAGNFTTVAGAIIGSLLTVGAQMFAWLTVVFAFMERVVSREQLANDAKPWTPDSLPVSRQSSRATAGACAAVVWDILLIALIVWQHFGRPYPLDGGRRVEILDPALWSGWIWPILAGLAGIATTQLIRATKPSWTIRLAGWHAAAHLVFTLPLVWVLYQREFFNPAFLTDIGGFWTTPEMFYNGVIVVVVLVSAIEIFKRFREAVTATVRS